MIILVVSLGTEGPTDYEWVTAKLSIFDVRHLGEWFTPNGNLVNLVPCARSSACSLPISGLKFSLRTTFPKLTIPHDSMLVAMDNIGRFIKVFSSAILTYVALRLSHVQLSCHFLPKSWFLTRQCVIRHENMKSWTLFEMNLLPFKEAFSEKRKSRKCSLLFSVLHPTAVTMSGSSS